jgi:hypothetical protein
LRSIIQRAGAASIAAMALLAVDRATAQPVEPPIGLGRGQMHPDFMLPKIDGGHLRLSDYRGKKILLFHFASW